VLLLAVLGFLAVSIAALSHPFDLELREGILFLPALKLAAGLPIYGEAVALAPPYVVAHYGPLYYAVLGSLLSFTGVVFWPGRLLSILGALTIAIGIWRLALRWSVSAEAALLASAAFLTFPGVWSYATTQRVDLFGLALMFLAIGAALGGDCRARDAAWAGVWTGAALLVKPTFVCGPAALLLALLSLKRRVPALCLLGCALGVLGLGYGLAIVAGVGDPRFALRIDAAGPYSIRPLMTIVKGAASSPLVFLGLLAWWLQAPELARSSSLRERFLAIYPALAASVGLAMSLRVGGSTNYLFELFVSLSLCLAYAARRGVGLCDDSRWRTPLVWALLIELSVFHAGFLRGRFAVPRQKAPLFQAIIDELRRLPVQAGPMMSDYPDLALRAGREPYFQTPGAFRVGPEPLRQMYEAFIAERRAVAIVTKSDGPMAGYRRFELGRYVPEDWGLANNDPGPFLFLREELPGTPAP
jgi:hypothetical protein